MLQSAYVFRKAEYVGAFYELSVKTKQHQEDGINSMIFLFFCRNCTINSRFCP